MVFKHVVFFAFYSFFQFSLLLFDLKPTLSHDWRVHRPQGTVRVLDFGFVSASVAQNYAEGLVGLDTNNNHVPCLAEDWRWIDDKTIEFKLRKGVTFHNGEIFNAEAVKINWQFYKGMETPRVIRLTELPDETELTVIDDYTVRFHLPKPDGLYLVKFWFFYMIAPSYFRQNQFDEKQWGYLREAGPWGTGPFRLVKGSCLLGKPSDEQILEAYEDYWDRKYPKLKRVIFDNSMQTEKAEAMRRCMEKEGQMDIVSNIRPLDTLKVAESSYANVVKSKDISVYLGWLNLRKTNSILNDLRIRKALNYAINREELWQYGAKGNAYNLGGYIPKGGSGHNPNLNLYVYDTHKARSLLTEAGYPDGFELRIIARLGDELLGQIITRMLQRIGLEVRIDYLKWPIEIHSRTYVPLLAKPPEQQDWDIFLCYWGDAYGHPGANILPYPFLEDSNMRWIKYDLEYEKMFEEMATTVDREVQERKMQEMAQYVYDKAYLLFIYSPLTLYAVNKEVNFVPQKGIWMRMKETSVTENHWSIRGKNN